MGNEFWLTDAQWSAIEPKLPHHQPGARRVDDRRVLSGIIHVLKSGCRWQDCPAVYGPSTTIYNRFHRWSGRGIWRRLFQAFAVADPDCAYMIDSTTAKTHRSAAGGKGGLRRRRSASPVAVARPKSMRSSMSKDGRSPSK
jgi:transposase